NISRFRSQIEESRRFSAEFNRKGLFDLAIGFEQDPRAKLRLLAQEVQRVKGEIAGSADPKIREESSRQLLDLDRERVRIEVEIAKQAGGTVNVRRILEQAAQRELQLRRDVLTAAGQ